MSLPRYLDGPKFVAFLLSEGIHKHQVPESVQRRWHDWERGARADVYTASVDRLLTDELLLDLIPDDCWSENQNPTRRGPTKRAESGQFATA